MKFFSRKYDTIFIEPGEPLEASYPLFESISGNSSIIREMDEQSLVDWLLFGKYGDDLSLFLHDPESEEEFFVSTNPSGFFKRTCAESTIFSSATKLPGDIDMLIVPTSKPQAAIAVQCKKIKIRADKSGFDNVNRIGELTGGAAQANLTLSMGFSRTYLVVVVAIDAEFSTSNNVITRDASPQTWVNLGKAIRNSGTKDGIGIIIIAATQLSGKDPENQGDVSFGLVRPARHLEQSSDLTERIVNYINVSKKCTTEKPDR